MITIKNILIIIVILNRFVSNNYIKMQQIEVKSIIKAPISKVWECWTSPKHIINWNFASND
jgi:hypothetical protein